MTSQDNGTKLKFYNDEERTLWDNVVLTQVGNAAPAHDAIQAANAVVRARQEACGQ